MLQQPDTQALADIFNNLRRIYQALNEQSKQTEKSTGLTGPQIWAILTVEREGSLSVSSLAAKMFLHPATVVGILNRLEDRGLVERKRIRSDRRTVWVELTALGKQCALEAPNIVQGKLATGLSRLLPDELDETQRSLARLVTILDAQDVKPQPIKALNS